MLKARDSLVKGLRANGNGQENEICGIAVVTALASERWNESSLGAVNDLYACLHILDVHGTLFFIDITVDMLYIIIILRRKSA